MSWKAATVIAARGETARARTLVLDVPGWTGSDAGQHVDVRLTAEDGYSTVRSYSIASATQRDRLELTVEEIGDGEVSPYLVETASIGDRLEVRGPIGGWFVWRPNQLEPIQLIGGGSGIVPLMAMIRNRSATASRAPFRLLYSVREPAAVLYAGELAECARDDGVRVTYVYTRAVPSGWPVEPRRIDAATIDDATLPASALPTCYVCGPSGFVETVADLLIAAGHAAERIKTERFGPTGTVR
jgi:ferredoxin-NADP reductase